MSLKSRLEAPETVHFRQLVPPSIVRRTVPCVPLAQTTLGLATLTPRSRAVVPLVCTVQLSSAGAEPNIALVKEMRITPAGDAFRPFRAGGQNGGDRSIRLSHSGMESERGKCHWRDLTRLSLR